MILKKLILGFTTLALLTLLSIQAQAISLYIEPTSTTVNVSDTFDINILLSDMADLNTSVYSPNVGIGAKFAGFGGVLTVLP